MRVQVSPGLPNFNNMTEHQKKLVNELIQVHICDIREKINECKAYKREAANTAEQEYLDESIKFWQEQMSEFKNIKL
jgi:hypothetical protein